VRAAHLSRQVRSAHRVELKVPATLYLADQPVVRCQTFDFSSSGLAIDAPAAVSAELATPVTVGLYRGDTEVRFAATVRFNRGTRLGLRFEPMDFAQERALVHCTTARADIWAARWGHHPRVAAHRVIGHIARISAVGFRDMFAHYRRVITRKLRPARNAAAAAAGAKEHP